MKALLGLLLPLALGLPADTLDGTPFESWTPAGTGVWETVEVEGRGSALHLKRSGKMENTKPRRPANLLIAPGGPVGAFTLEVEVKSLNISEKGADVCLFFGIRDERNYVYVHLSNDSDNRSHQVIMKVEGDKGIRGPIQRERDPEPSLTGNWRRVRLVREPDGVARVYVEDMDRPVMTAQTDPDLKGHIGLGSFNDPAMFDTVRLREGASPE